MTWQIESNAGVILGEYEGETAEVALDAVARDAGYRSHADSCEVLGTPTDDWTSDRFAFRRGSIGLLVTEVYHLEYLSDDGQWCSPGDPSACKFTSREDGEDAAATLDSYGLQGVAAWRVWSGTRPATSYADQERARRAAYARRNETEQ